LSRVPVFLHSPLLSCPLRGFVKSGLQRCLSKACEAFVDLVSVWTVLHCVQRCFLLPVVCPFHPPLELSPLPQARKPLKRRFCTPGSGTTRFFRPTQPVFALFLLWAHSPLFHSLLLWLTPPPPPFPSPRFIGHPFWAPGRLA